MTTSGLIDVYLRVGRQISCRARKRRHITVEFEDLYGEAVVFAL